MDKAKIRPIVIVIVAVMAMISLIGCKASTNQQEGTKIVAKVNEESIPIEDFDRYFKILEREYNLLYGDKIWSQEIGNKTYLQFLKEQLLEKLITYELLTQKSIEKGITIDEEEIEKAYSDVQAQLKDDEELKAFYEENGIDEAFLKEKIKKELYYKKYREELFEELGLNDEDNITKILDEYPVEVKVRHILITDEAKAEEILERIKKGEDFAALAREYSEDPVSKENGGDLGYFKRGALVYDIDKKAFSLNVGEVSDLVKTQLGYHIIKVEDIKYLQDLKDEIQDENEFEEERNSIIESIKESKFLENIEELRAEATIEKYEENIK